MLKRCVKKMRKLKTQKNIILVIFSLISLNSCFGLWDSDSDEILGNYIIGWIDLEETRSISERVEKNSSGSVGLIPEYVFAVGNDKRYIIAKQHPTSGFENGFEINTSITNYFIIDASKSALYNQENVFGPLNKNEFDSLRKKWNIEKIEFDKNYPEKL